MFRTLAFRGLLGLVLVLASPMGAQVTTWDAARDFSGAQNPNGQWTYGWKASASSSLTTFPTYEATLSAYPGRDAWQDLSRSTLLGVYHNTIGVTGDIPTTMLLLQPDPAGDLAVLEWTAPASQSVNVQGIFQSLDTAAAQVSVVSSVSGTRFSGTVNGTTTTSSFGLFLNVAAGEKIDFVASGGGAGVNVVISTLKLLGKATILSIAATDTRLRLTPPIGTMTGGTWNLSKQRLSDGFDSSFLFQISQIVGQGADGFAFVIQNSSTTALGGNLGYDSIPSSLAIEFDTFQNTWDNSGNQISVHTNGTSPNSALESSSIGSTSLIPNMKDGNWHVVHIHYGVQPQPLLAIYLDNLNSPALQIAVDIVSKLKLSDGTAWVGFTASTGAGNAEIHDIQNWHFLSYDLHPPVLTLPANITLEGNTLGGALVTFTASAMDAVDGARPVTCTPASGSLFPVAKTTVQCSSTDLSGNTANGSFTVTVTDTTPPVLAVPLSVTAAAVDRNGAPVSYIATATDIVDGNIVPVCSPASGSVFALGTTTVSCTATDKSGNSASQTFSVAVTDQTPPVISGLSNLLVEAAGTLTTVSWPGVTATDNVDGTVAVVCSPASGAQFSVGSFTVQCSATDAAGNRSTGSFTVTVQDTTPPAISGMPANMTVEASSPSGATASWPSPAATDLVDGSVSVTCLPASGSTFALGQTLVSCSATDAHGNTASKTFKVTVQDTTPPLISGMPANFTLEATGPSGAAANWPSPTATDLVDGTVPVTCLPASGSTFALGQTVVTCSATDLHGNTASKTFTVTVQDTTPPVISGMPGNLTVGALTSSGTVASWPSPTATDLVDGVVSVVCSPPSGSVFPLGNSTVVCSATDAHGNKSVSSFIVTVQLIDTTPPVISCGRPDGLWHASDVAIACSASDSGSGLANPADASFVLTTSVLFGTETANAATNSHSVCDRAGNCATAGPIAGNAVDKHAPAIAIATPVNAVYALRQPVAASYSCVDGGSGVAACNGPVPTGASIDTASVGTKQFTVNASDKVGNASTASVSYTVGYALCLLGHEEPKEEDSTIPVRVEICDYAGKNLSSQTLQVFALGLIGANGTATPLQVAGDTDPSMHFRYVGARDGGAYLFNLKTNGFVAGTYQLLVGVGGDPASHAVTFQIGHRNYVDSGRDKGHH